MRTLLAAGVSVRRVVHVFALVAFSTCEGGIAGLNKSGSAACVAVDSSCPARCHGGLAMYTEFARLHVRAVRVFSNRASYAGGCLATTLTNHSVLAWWAGTEVTEMHAVCSLVTRCCPIGAGYASTVRVTHVRLEMTKRALDTITCNSLVPHVAA